MNEFMKFANKHPGIDPDYEPLTLDDYQSKTRIFAKYPEAGTGTIMALAYCGLGLGEAGEVQGKIKKILRDDDGVVTDEKREAIAQEVGDILWYVAGLAEELGFTLEQVAQMNLDKLQSRFDRGVLGGSGDNR